MPTSQFDILTQKAPLPRAWTEDARKFPIVLGLISTVLIHLLLWFLAPLLPLGETQPWQPKEKKVTTSLDFILERLPEAPLVPEQLRYVVTNQDAPANEPDKTKNYSDRNQQSAQEAAATEIDPDNLPTVKGRENIDPTNAVVTGDGAPVQEAVPEVPPLPSAQPVEAARAQQIPLPGLEKNVGETPDGVGTNVSPPDIPSTQSDQYQQGVPDSHNLIGDNHQAQPGGQPTPRARPRLKPAPSSVLANHLAGTRNIGVIGIDARWSAFGEYLTEFWGIVEAKWHQILNSSTIIPSNGRVVITFVLNAEGEVRIVKIEDFIGQYGTYAGITALQEPQPYRKWTEPMIALMGTEQQLTIELWYY